MEQQELESYPLREKIPNEDIPYKYINQRKIDILQEFKPSDLDPERSKYIPDLEKFLKTTRDNQLIIIYFLKEYNWNLQTAKEEWSKLSDLFYANKFV